MNPKAQALNKAQQQLRPELYFPEFLKRGSAHLTDSSKKSEIREEVIANNNTGLVKPVKIQNNKNLCCAKNITEYRTNKKLLDDLCCAKNITEHRTNKKLLDDLCCAKIITEHRTNKKLLDDLCCAKNITEYRTNKKLLEYLCCAKNITEYRTIRNYLMIYVVLRILLMFQ